MRIIGMCRIINRIISIPPLLSEMARMVCGESLDNPPWKASPPRSSITPPALINGLDLDQLFQIAYPGGQGTVMSLDEMNEEWWCDLPSASFPADTVIHTKWVQYIELSTDVL